MSSYTLPNDWISSVSVVEEVVSEVVEEVVEVVSKGVAKPDSPINQDPLPVPSIDIPSISLDIINLVKHSNLSKQMKKRILELPLEMLEYPQAIGEVIYLVENKRTLKKAIELVFKIEE